MKREILFRGMRVDNGEWVYGSYHYSANRQNHYILALEKFNSRIGNEEALHSKEVSVVRGDTVGQYTGLTDRNGVKVYEGDMDRYGNYVGYWLVMSGFYLTKDGAITGTLTSDFEIASNIHTP